jgi:hypothetical protein
VAVGVGVSEGVAVGVVVAVGVTVAVGLGVGVDCIAAKSTRAVMFAWTPNTNSLGLMVVNPLGSRTLRT